MPPPTTTTTTDLDSLLTLALPFLRDTPSAVPSNPPLPSLLSALRAAGAAECWHKHGTFLAHLTCVHRILILWRAPSPLPVFALFHSAYSNSYVNLAIFPPSPASRSSLRSLLGAPAERLVHLFCSVPRHHLIHHLLLFRFTDADLSSSLEDIDQPWRIKINEVVPVEGIRVNDIRTGEEIRVSRRDVGAFLLMTMADFGEQLYGFQDRLFGNEDGRMEFSGGDVKGGIWPGDGKPGLWINAVSRMGAIYRMIVREEEICGGEEMVIPPVFERCTRVLGVDEQRKARDLYWEVVVGNVVGEEKEGMLKESCELNPFVGETFLVLGQVLLGKGKWEEGEREVEKGLKLLLEWGTGWDKRVSWEGWVAWGRVLLMKAREKEWPNDAWGINNLGLVR